MNRSLPPLSVRYACDSTKSSSIRNVEMKMKELSLLTMDHQIKVLPSAKCSAKSCSIERKHSSPKRCDPDEESVAENSDHTRERLLRRDIVTKLETRLRIQCVREKKALDSTSKLMIRKSAKVLEQLLFQSASDLDTYSDEATLDARIRILLTVKLQRRLREATKRNRPQNLQKILGMERYVQIRNLLNEIKIEKTTIIARQTTCCGSRDACGIASQKKTMPLAVRNLFFDGSLSDAFERSPVETINEVDWDVLVSSAQKNLRMLREWSRNS